MEQLFSMSLSGNSYHTPPPSCIPAWKSKRKSSFLMLIICFFSFWQTKLAAFYFLLIKKKYAICLNYMCNPVVTVVRNLGWWQLLSLLMLPSDWKGCGYWRDTWWHDPFDGKKVIIKQRISSRSRTNKSTWRLLRQRKTLAEGYKRTDYQLSQNRSPSMWHQPSLENHSWMHQQVAVKISKNGIH